MGKQQLARASRLVTRANKLAHATRCVARRFKGDGTLAPPPFDKVATTRWVLAPEIRALGSPGAPSSAWQGGGSPPGLA